MVSRTRAAATLLAGALLLSACATGEEAETAADAPDAAATTEDDGATATDDATDGDGAEDDGATDDGAAEGSGGGAAAADDADPAGDDDVDADDADAGAATGSPVLATEATAPDGSTFTIGDFAGQPVFVETFATWCSTCRRQLGATQQAAVEAGDDAVFLILSVETSIDPAALADYAAEQGFDDLRFGRLDEQGLATFADAFGRSVLNPPSTPKFRVGPDGGISELTTGMESAEEILATLDAA